MHHFCILIALLNKCVTGSFVQNLTNKRTPSPSLLIFAATTPNHNGGEKNNNDEPKRSYPKPIDPQHWPERFPAKQDCSRCGLCETSFVKYVSTSCAFLNDGMARIDNFEGHLHGRQRRRHASSSTTSPKDDELRLGVLYEPIMLAKGVNIELSESGKRDTHEPQWTGVTTNIAISMLEQGFVDAVVCIASEPDHLSSTPSFAAPQPIIAKDVKTLLRGRGVKPSLAPSLAVLDELKEDKSIRKLLFCGVGCAVQAFRAIEHTLELDKVYVLGTNCADNSPSSYAANNFLQKGMDIDDTSDVLGYEFMQDYKVHVKMKNSSENIEKENRMYRTKPYFCLPSEIAEDAIADSCLACFDYTNALADVVVGYMGAPLNRGDSMDNSFQTLTCRNEKGKEMIEVALQAKKIILGPEAASKTPNGLIPFQNLALSTVQNDGIVQGIISEEINKEEKNRTMPLMIGEVLATLLVKIGPRNLNFAYYSIDYHLLRNYLIVLDKWGTERADQSLPKYAKDVVKHYTDHYADFRKLKSAILNKKENIQ